MNRPLSAREDYQRRLGEARREASVTSSEEGMTRQQAQFHHSIMATYNVSFEESKQMVKNAQKSRSYRRKISSTINDDSAGHLPAKSPRRKPPVSTKPSYKYSAVTVNAPSSVVNRYQADYSTSARRYRDTATGETISRRERDKRIASEILDER